MGSEYPGVPAQVDLRAPALAEMATSTDNNHKQGPSKIGEPNPIPLELEAVLTKTQFSNPPLPPTHPAPSGPPSRPSPPSSTSRSSSTSTSSTQPVSASQTAPHYSGRWHNVPQPLEHSEGILTHGINRTALQDLLGCIAGESTRKIKHPTPPPSH
jgi:hypothetical protein